MSSTTEICNLALSHLGIGKEIASLTEGSEEAAACNRFYAISLRIVLSKFAWPFATRFVALGLVEEDPTSEWAYSYRYPSDALSIRRILSGARTDSRASRVAYRIASDATGLLIYTDYEDAEVEYTVDITNAASFPDDFAEALSYRMAASMAPRLTGGDPFGLGAKAEVKYKASIASAAGSSFNEEQPDLPPESEFILERG